MYTYPCYESLQYSERRHPTDINCMQGFFTVRNCGEETTDCPERDCENVLSGRHFHYAKK